MKIESPETYLNGLGVGESHPSRAYLLLSIERYNVHCAELEQATWSPGKPHGRLTEIGTRYGFEFSDRRRTNVITPQVVDQVRRHIDNALREERHTLDVAITNAAALNTASRRQEPDRYVPGEGREPRVDIGILSIKPEEFEALLEAFPDGEGIHVGKNGRHFNLRTADAGRGATYTVALVRQVEQGTGEAQDAARDLLDELHPQLILVVGIAGGAPKSDFTLGDVVLSLRVHDYTVEAQKVATPVEYAISGGPMARQVEGHVTNLQARRRDLGDWWVGLPERPPVDLDPGNFGGPSEWQDEVRKSLAQHFVEQPRNRPKFLAGVIGSSDRLIKDPTVLIAWLQTSRNLLAIEMESAGAYRAARERCAMLAIRGISDIVGFKRDERWTHYACATAAAFAKAYLRTTPVSPGGGAAVLPDLQPSSPAAPKRHSQEPGSGFLPHGAVLQSKKGGLAPSVAWQLQVTASQTPDATRAELHKALVDSVVTYDLRDHQRTARWPRLPFIPSAAISGQAGGAQSWRHEYKDYGNEIGVEQLLLQANGSLLFQRDTLWDVDELAIDFGSMARDTLMFIAFAQQFLSRIRSEGDAEVMLRLKISQSAPGAFAVFHATTVRSEQPDRNAFLRKTLASGTARLSGTDQSDERLIATTKRLLDRVANEFELETSLAPSNQPAFLAIDETSLLPIVKLILP